MAQYLSPEWFADMEVAAASHVGAESTGKVALRETVTGSPFGTVSYVMTIEDGKVSITLDADTVADVTFTQDYETASALHRGELSMQEAFFAGRVRVAGHLNTLLDNADLLQGIAPTFESVRASTTY